MRGLSTLCVDWGSYQKKPNIKKVNYSPLIPLSRGCKGVLVPSGHRPGPTEAAAETRPLEKLYIILKIEIPLPHQSGALFAKILCAGGG